MYLPTLGDALKVTFKPYIIAETLPILQVTLAEIFLKVINDLGTFGLERLRLAVLGLVLALLSHGAVE